MINFIAGLIVLPETFLFLTGLSFIYWVENYYIEVYSLNRGYSRDLNNTFNFILLNFILIFSLYLVFLEADDLLFKFQYYNNRTYFQILMLLSAIVLTPGLAFLEEHFNVGGRLYIHFLMSVYLSLISIYCNDFASFYILIELYSINF